MLNHLEKRLRSRAIATSIERHFSNAVLSILLLLVGLCALRVTHPLIALVIMLFSVLFLLTSVASYRISANALGLMPSRFLIFKELGLALLLSALVLMSTISSYANYKYGNNLIGVTILWAACGAYLLTKWKARFIYGISALLLGFLVIELSPEGLLGSALK